MFLFKIFVHQSFGLFNFFLRCLLRLFLEAAYEYHKAIFIKTAKYPVNVAALHYPDLIQTFYIYNSLKIFSRNDLLCHYKEKHLINLSQGLTRYGPFKVLKIM